jgi:dihydropteroate synthase
MYRLRVLSLKNRNEIADELRKIGVDPGGINKLTPKGVVRITKVSGLPSAAGHILKQTMLSIGGDVAVSHGSLTMRETTTDALIIGTENHYRRLIENLKLQPLDLSQLSARLEKALFASGENRFVLALGEHTLELGKRTLLMGVVNVTPDSFSDGGDYLDPAEAADRCFQLVDDGADIVDVGGESTRPGAEAASEETELRRVMPVLERISGKMKVPVSIDTVKPRVAREALSAGAAMVNDISGLRDPELVSVVSESGAAVIVMHMKGTPRTMQDNPHYDDLMGEIIAFLEERVGFAVASGVEEDKVLIDPGIGFGKTVDHNYQIIDRLEELRCLGRPIVVGPSRKSFIGKVVNAEAGQRVFGTAAAVTWCIANGADIVRVHDVKEMKQVAAVADRFLAVRSGAGRERFEERPAEGRR